jgi:predicted O-methyltransferase YrrM
MGLKEATKNVIKSLAFTTPLHRFLFNVYPFMYSPAELCFLSQSLADLHSVPGAVVEAGCAYGATTVWLSKAMTERGISRDYYAIDTFCGFTEDQIAYERQHRAKPEATAQMIRATFCDNRQDWFDKSMALHGVAVRSIEGDVETLDFQPLGPIAFCLVDVDLYLPIKTALPRIYDVMSPGGLIVVDDCWPDEKWDGAFQAYLEFTDSRRIRPEIVGRKLGLIRR